MDLFKICVVGLLMVSSLGMSQNSPIEGKWQLSKVESGGKVYADLKAVYGFSKGGKLEASRSVKENPFVVGTWKYNKDDQILVMNSDLDKDFNGEASILKVSNDHMIYKKDGAILYFNKLELTKNPENKENSLVVIEKLDFTIQDFFDDNDEYKYYKDEQKLPWNDTHQMLQSLANVKQLVYDYVKIDTDGSNNDDLELIAHVESDVEQSLLSIDFIFYGYDRYNLPEDAELPPNNEFENLLYPEKENTFRVIGNEKLSTSMGTFNCTVIEVAGEMDECRKLWMINDKPGVYAKIIVYKPGDWGYSAVYKLKAIKSK